MFWLLALVILLVLALWALLPRAQVDRSIEFSATVLGSDPEVWLEVSEQQFGDIRPGAAKRIQWAGARGAKTPLAVIYVPGFGASAEEIRPLPDEVAKALGANLFYTRLNGQGRSAEAMLEPSAGDWIEDMAEAMAIGRMIGERSLVIATSMGGTLATIAATDPVLSQGMLGLVLVSPAYKLHPGANFLIDAPLPQFWANLVAGSTQSFAAVAAEHQRYFLASFPTLALLPMGALMREARAQDYSQTEIPLLVFYAKDDQVVDSRAIAPITSTWGGAVRIEERRMQAGDDPAAHVIAGDVYSPGQTEEMVALILEWVRSDALPQDLLPPAP